jgi:hypothetical protein
MPANLVHKRTLNAQSAPSAPPVETTDPTLRALRQHLRQANVTALPHYIRQATRKAADERTPARLQSLLYAESARALYALGQPAAAARLLDEAERRLPFGALDITSFVRQLRARALLDAEDTKAARALAEECDAIIIDRGKDTPSLVSRNEEQVSVETWILHTEIALIEGKIEEAQTFLARAIAAHARDEDERARRRVRLTTSAAQREQLQRVADTHQRLRFLEALCDLAAGDAAGFERLARLEHQLQSEADSNQTLLACVRAASGSWTDVSDDPPPGISLAEARRWQRTASANFTRSERDRNHEKDEVETSEQARNSVAAPPANTVENATVEALRQLAASMMTFVERATQNQEPLINDKIAYGGSFAHFDFVSMLCNAEATQLTGYFHVKWKPENLEPNFRAGRLDGRAAVGQGYVFLCDGRVIDATLGGQTPPAELADDERDARDALLIMLRIGLGIALLTEPEGFAQGIADASVRQRRQRIHFEGKNENLLMSMITEVEKTFGISEQF